MLQRNDPRVVTKKTGGPVSQSIVTYSCIDFSKKMSSLANLITIKISTCGLLNLLSNGGLLSDFFWATGRLVPRRHV